MTDPVQREFAASSKLLTDQIKVLAEELLALTGAAGFIVSGPDYVLAMGSRESVMELLGTDLPEMPK